VTGVLTAELLPRAPQWGFVMLCYGAPSTPVNAVFIACRWPRVSASAVGVVCELYVLGLTQLNEGKDRSPGEILPRTLAGHGHQSVTL
jgi:hypothetical protein